MTSTSRRVAALPLRETTQIAPFGRMRRPASASGARSAVDSAPSRTTSVSGSGQPSVRSVVRSAMQRADVRVVDVDERDAHPRPDPELVEQRRGVDAFHGRYRATHAAGVRASLRDLRLRARPPADAAAVRPGDRPAARGRGRAGSGARSRRPTRSCCGATRGATSRSSSGSRSTRSGRPRRASARAATIRRSPGCTRPGRWSPVARSGRSRRSCAATSSMPSTRAAGSITRCPTGRRGSASTTTRRWRSPGRGATACASCTSTSTSTTATASRRSTGTTRAS